MRLELRYMQRHYASKVVQQGSWGEAVMANRDG